MERRAATATTFSVDTLKAYSAPDEASTASSRLLLNQVETTPAAESACHIITNNDNKRCEEQRTGDR